MQPFQTTANVITQGQARRGYFAAYLPADHGDIKEFLECREEGSPIQDISLGVCFSDEFLNEAKEGKEEYREVLARYHKKRFESGFPYAFFTDNVNRQRPQVYKDKNMLFKNLQMCNEIYEYVDEHVSFVCCISSLNALHYDEYKNTDAGEVMAKFLYAVYEEFIDKAKTFHYGKSP